MESYGTLIITLEVIKLFADGRVIWKPVQVSRVNTDRSTAIMMMKEHKERGQAANMQGHYIYAWQPAQEQWTTRENP